MDGSMTEEAITANGSSAEPGGASAQPRRREPFPLPGLAAIGLYLSALAGIIIMGVVRGNYPPLFLVFPVVFLAASGGLMLLFRWAWALVLAAVFLMATFNMWIFASLHEPPALVQGLLNWVFFLYLIRTEVRSKLR